jgi:negative regulator of flagellin synthesis FlgM
VAQDRVELSEGVKSASTEAVFDADRVAELRQAIADGQYPLDAKRIAESFASIERLL